MDSSLPKVERLCGKKAISALFSGGKWDYSHCLKSCFLAGNGLEYNRIMVSVPKRSFKRAVKRNLLKRRMREAYRLQKGLLSGGGRDIMFVFSGKEEASYADVYADMTALLTKIAAR